ncbi:hypothetical protein K435DRAFT_810287 [Dendrothele bispora CBS 962.96]|uniref:Uncharacterized protein n=1 Tax=Dendrothele bispora (strain CBS 962.96) TaxID=1314807 RepID=A0A4S8KVX2_DENBC|nr:hypothetical protein K435DRAFT_810287 [Dendrothele bispora CBS 962.96]
MDSFKQLTCADPSQIESFENDDPPPLRLPTPTPTFQPLYNVTNSDLSSHTEPFSSHSLENEFGDGSFIIPSSFNSNEFIGQAPELSDTAIQALDCLSKMSTVELDSLIGVADFDPSFFEELELYRSAGAQDDQASVMLMPSPSAAANLNTGQTTPSPAQSNSHCIDESAPIGQVQRQDMLSALHVAYKKFLGEVENLGEQFSVKPEKLLLLIKSSSHWNEQRKVNSHNAALHFLKGSTDSDGNKLRGKELHELAKTDPEVQEILSDPLRLQKLKDDVNEHRQKKAQGAHTSSNSSAQDIRLTIDSLLREEAETHKQEVDQLIP